MEEKGHTWSNLETWTLLKIWSKEEIQRELWEAVCNDLAYIRIVTELAGCRCKETVDQCRVKIKALKTKYKEIMDKPGRRGTGRESNEFQELTVFPYFTLSNRVLRRIDVPPVNLLSFSSAEANPRNSGSPSSSTPETSISRPDTPSAASETSVSRPDTPAAAIPETAVSRPHTPAVQPSSSCDTLVRLPREYKHPRKDAKGQTECIEQRYQQIRWWKTLWKVRKWLKDRGMELEAKYEERGNERDWQFMTAVTSMMVMMRQYSSILPSSAYASYASITWIIPGN